MPRYDFTVSFRDGAALAPITDRFADADAAWEAARDMVAGLLAAEGDPRLLGAVLTAADEEGEVVFELPFAEIAAAPPRRPDGRLH